MFYISFRCYYNDGSHTTHRQELAVCDIPKWLEAYKFTHPTVQSITVKVWFNDQEEA